MHLEEEKFHLEEQNQLAKFTDSNFTTFVKALAMNITGSETRVDLYDTFEYENKDTFFEHGYILNGRRCHHHECEDEFTDKFMDAGPDIDRIFEYELGFKLFFLLLVSIPFVFISS